MRFSERLYAIPGAGNVQPWASYWQRNGRTSATSTAAAASVRNTFESRYILLTSACVIAQPGAGQNFTQIQIDLLGADNSVPTPPWLLKFTGTAGAANVVGSIDWSGEMIVLPGWSIRGNAEYNAGANANITTVAFYGYTLPIGTLQAF